MKNIFHIWLNSLVLLYMSLAYGLGIWSITKPQWLLNSVGVILIVHALLLSAMMTHEFIHGTVFQRQSLNNLLGNIMTHINGACYIPYATIAQNHFYHHVWHVDRIPFDYEQFVKNFPPIIRKICVALEWCYFPIFGAILRWRCLVAPFINKTERRWRVFICLVYRGILFGILAIISPKAIVLYAISYVCFTLVMRAIETFQHTYEYWISDIEPPARIRRSSPKENRLYEQTNTFSGVIATGHFSWLNLIYLNFGYHNAHHHDMRTPWYKLPQLHNSLYGEEAKNILLLPKMAGNYHRFRVARLLGIEQGDVSSLNDFAGAIGISLLTPP